MTKEELNKLEFPIIIAHMGNYVEKQNVKNWKKWCVSEFMSENGIDQGLAKYIKSKEVMKDMENNYILIEDKEEFFMYFSLSEIAVLD